MPQLIAALPLYRAAAERVREQWLAHLALLAETPAPTFGEQARAELLAERFAAAGLQSCVVDAYGNASALCPGTGGGASTLLLAAHADTLPTDGEPPEVEIYQDTTGPASAPPAPSFPWARSSPASAASHCPVGR
jgi:acetylornithine deacetylase/succinyl-diaminopimelate desuccinylase-like protein